MNLFAHSVPSAAAFPVRKAGRLLHRPFRGLLSVHSRYGLHAHRVAMRPFSPKASAASLPPPLLRLLPGGTNQLPGGTSPRCGPAPFHGALADKGYHSNQTMIDLAAVGLRSYVAEPDRGRRDWSQEPQARIPVYANRRRIRGARGRRLMRQRGERIERSFAHLYDTGGMRRTHLRGHTNILKRLLIHAGGFNLGLVMRHLIGSGTPRGLQDRPAIVITTLMMLLGATRCWLVAISAWHPLMATVRSFPSPITTTRHSSAATTYTTGC
jgi:hypothetical protein